MSLRRFAVRNYKCFRTQQEIEIFPVTVVLGKNNSGKSALVRAPLVFEAGFGVDTHAPLDLERVDVEPVDAFTDLIFGHNQHGSIGVDLEVEEPVPFRLAANIQHLDETREALVSELTVSVPEGQVRLEWQPELVATGPPRQYRVDTGEQPIRTAPVDFQGLLPTVPSVSLLRRWLNESPSLGTIRYLSPYRERLQRHHRLPLAPPSEVGPQGAGVPALLAHDYARRNEEVIARVNSYLKEIVPDWILREVPVGPLFSTVLTRRSGGDLRVNLADAGAGLAQVLPILVQCALDEQAGRRDQVALQIIEEPEMHLHPAAHAELADLYLRTAKATGTRFLVETHSETLLLRLRRRIAEGDYPPEMVGVYVVEQQDGESSTRQVDVDRLGNLSEEWPEGYFSMGYHDARALASAQLRRSGDAAEIDEAAPMELVGTAADTE